MKRDSRVDQATRGEAVRHTRGGRARRRRRWLTWTAVALSLFFSASFALSMVVLFLTPWGNQLRLIAAETVISTRHGYLARYFTSPQEYQSLRRQLNAPVYNSSANAVRIDLAQSEDSTLRRQKRPVIEIHPIQGPTYNGYVMLVHDPRRIRLVPAMVVGGMGEYITHIARRVGAVAGVNASGFLDPKGGGWGGVPEGLVVVGGHILHPAKTSPGWVSVGFKDDGTLVMGQYSPQQLLAMGVRDAVQFHPELVVDGKPMITEGDGGWGYGPRTAIGQAKDGTVIFVVTNGRFHGGAGVGASQRQVMDVMLRYGAVNACAMDGGSSSVLYHDGRILNSPSTIDPSGQRHLPNAWMVFPSDQAAEQFRP
jgi:exopolysaccharide biosynthesis protein